MRVLHQNVALEKCISCSLHSMQGSSMIIGPELRSAVRVFCSSFACAVAVSRSGNPVGFVPGATVLKLCRVFSRSCVNGAVFDAQDGKMGIWAHMLNVGRSL